MLILPEEKLVFYSRVCENGWSSVSSSGCASIKQAKRGLFIVRKLSQLP